MTESKIDDRARRLRASGRPEREVQLELHLSRLFEGIDPQLLRDLEADVEWTTLRGGEVLFHQDDVAEHSFLVISGRLRVVIEENDGERVLDEVGSGETVGEMALLTDDPRSGTVYAVRDTQLVRLSRAAFERLTVRYPEALRRIAGFVVDRLRRQTSSARETRTPLVTLTVVASQPGVDLGDFARRLSSGLRAIGSVQHINRAQVDDALGRNGKADFGNDESDNIRLVQWLNNRDAASRYVVYEADTTWSAWTERAVRQADHVLIVSRDEDGPAIGEVEKRLTYLWRGARAPLTGLVLLHPDGAEPDATRRWLDVRNVEQHYHVRRNSDADYARVARLLTGHGVGLVFGGGGARGFAHLGVLRALEEAGVPIDAVGGTSIGAIIAAFPAMGNTAAEALAISRRGFSSLLDPTFPLLALIAGHRIAANLRAFAGTREIEDLLISYFCVSTNLSLAKETVHRRGSLLHSVRSSISLPGILAPATMDGDLFVDGGLLNNLPIDVMRDVCNGGPIIAVDVSPEHDLRARWELDYGVSGWRLLWQRLNPFGKRLEFPYISSVLMRSAVVASIASDRRQHRADMASLYLRIPVEKWSLLDFDSVDDISALGFAATAQRIRNWWDQRKE